MKNSYNELTEVKFKLFFKHLVQSRNSQLHLWFIITVHFALVFKIFSTDLVSTRD